MSSENEATAVRSALARVLERHELSRAEMQAAMNEILEGAASQSQLAALAIALRMRGESAGELAAAAGVLRARADRVQLEVDGPILDTCGTGGDGLGTFNISTVAAIVVASAGVTVAKHGNRAVSSKAGSADVLEALGVRIDLPVQRVGEIIRTIGIGFLFAPAHHGAMKHAAPVRRELGVRTFFNLLGPLANPAGATHQLLGVYDRTRVRTMCEVLQQLGSHGAWVVHGAGGLDEISTEGPTHVAKLVDGVVVEAELSPAHFGLEPVPLRALVGGDAEVNGAIARTVLSGEKSAPRTAVLLNAAAALMVAGRADTPREGAQLAAACIDDGRAGALLERWAAETQA